MKSIVTTYPDFQMLPKGVKQLLVASETFFFQDSTPSSPVITGQTRQASAFTLLWRDETARQAVERMKQLMVG
jgi:hypothetical protein